MDFVNVCGILVTFNRLEKLKKTINAYDSQKYSVKSLVIIDNASTDGTKEFLDEWQKEEASYKKVVVHMETNTGGSGGFTKGIEVALKEDVEWVYLSDDDAYLTDEALTVFNDSQIVKGKGYDIVCGEVDSPDGISYFHRRKSSLTRYNFYEVDSTKEDYDKDYFEMDLFSFVGVFIRKSCILDVGLPMKDYFIWYDDTEYSYRLTRKHKAVCIPKIKIYHDCKMADIVFCWKNYYGYRNKLDALKRNFPIRYYRYFKNALYISSLLDIFKNNKKRKVKRDAIKAAKKGILGISEKYKPGTKI